MKKKIAVIFGGYSSEFEISVKSGKNIFSVIDKNLFDVYQVLISPQKWEVIGYGEINKKDFSFEQNGKKTKFDAAVIVIHGTPGEDGILQSYFELIGLPYISCNPLAAGLTFNKFYCNYYLNSFGVKISKSVLYRKNQDLDLFCKEAEKKLRFPVFVKPNAGGSSFGTTKVKSPRNLCEAIGKALKESPEVIVEEFVKGRELTCAVLKINGQIQALTPIEIRSKHEFFDYEAKYNPDLNEEIIPAPVPRHIIEKVKQTSEKIYNLLNCNGIVRIDYILTEDEELYFLELNSIPGMTAESIVPKMAAYDKINLTDVYTELINEAVVKI